MDTKTLITLVRGAWFQELTEGFVLYNNMQHLPHEELCFWLMADWVELNYNEMVETQQMQNVDHNAVAYALIAQMAFFGML